EVIEKDFWVCWALKHIFELGPAPTQLIFKGGTSLSKVYGVIERFSEDIDLSLSRDDLGFSGERNPYDAPSGKKQKALIKELVSKWQQVIATELLPRVRARFETVLGPEGNESAKWNFALDEIDPQTVNFGYPPGLQPSSVATGFYVRPVVRLELGARSD